MLNINTYDAYGNKTASNATYASRFAYTGQVWLKELGLYYYKARMYNADLGRFMQTDPIGYGDGMNWYAYVGNDPVNRIDPLGLEEVDYSEEVGVVAHQDGSSANSSRSSYMDSYIDSFIAQEGAEKSGVRLGIHSNVPSDSDFTAGHAWISVTDADGNVTNYGLWPDEHPMTVDNGAGSDVRVGMENGQVAVVSKYFDLTVDQSTRLNTFLSTSAEWGYTHTCADWARDAVNYSTGQRIDVDDWLGFETPRELSRSLGK